MQTQNMLAILQVVLVSWWVSLVTAGPFDFNYPNVKEEVYDQPINLMSPKRNPHLKSEPEPAIMEPGAATEDAWKPYDFSKFDAFLNTYGNDENREHNRLKRRAKRRRGRGGRRRSKLRGFSTPAYEDDGTNGNTTQQVPIARRGDEEFRQLAERKGKRKNANSYDTYKPAFTAGGDDYRMNKYVEMPKDLYQAHLRPGVIFRIHMSEAILKMQYRNYGEDKDESVIEADVEYLRLTRKVINDEITKFEDLKWLVGWFNNRSNLIEEHMCNTRYFLVGIPPTMFTTSEEYMKRMCLFDNVYVDHIPYVVGEDSSLMAAVAPPVLHCDAATCTSVPFIDSLMFDERLPRTNVRTVTRCQASCRAHCRNDPDCLKRCSDRCLRAE